jgi:hypothetical protein
MPYLNEYELPVGGTTGAGEVCGSVGTAGLAAPFWEGGLADGGRGAATEQCKSMHINVDDDIRNSELPVGRVIGPRVNVGSGGLEACP